MSDHDDLLALDKRRREAIAGDDAATLRELLAPELVHVHGRGNRQSLEEYLAHLRDVVDVLEVRRGDVDVRVHGDCAVMTGRQTNLARARGSDEDPIEIESTAMQVWVRRDHSWQQVAFQATPIGAPPPAPPVR